MKIAVISGASSGMGAEFAKALDTYGFDELWLIAIEQDLLDKMASCLNTKARLFCLDLTKEESFDELRASCEKVNPEIEYLICSAGIGFNGPLNILSQKQINLTVSLNCTGLTLLINALLPYITKGGRIINIASGSGFTPQPYFSVYSASKAYVVSLSRAIGYELKKYKISVTAVCPGPVDTRFFSALENVKDYKRKYLISPQKVAVGSLKAAKKRKPLYIPTISIKLVHLASKLLPTSLILKFYKE